MPSNLIPKEFIQNLISQIDIVDIISQRIDLKKIGSNFKSLCPFHNEKTPSFTVNQHKQFYNCFGCGAHGNVIGFLMAFDKLSFLETIETIASHLGVTVVKKTTNNNFSFVNKNQLENIYKLLDKKTNFYRKELYKNNNVLDYLLNTRKLTKEICNYFLIGFSPPNDYFQKYLNNRIIFPIRNEIGKIIGFGARKLDDKSKTQQTNLLPKYINSPESDIFSKRKELYGLYEIKKILQKQPTQLLNNILVVEGYMDVISLHQYGIQNVVASLGTSITKFQIQKLFKNFREIIFCFDGDLAGINAAQRALKIILPIMRDGIEVKFLLLPQNEDPDSLIKKTGKEFFIQFIKNAKSFSDFLFETTANNIDLNTISGKAKFINDIYQLLKNMPSIALKQLLLEKLSDITKTDVNKIIEELTITSNLHIKTCRNNNDNYTVNLENFAINPIYKAINLLLNNPELATSVNKQQIEIILKRYTINNNQSIDIKIFIEVYLFLQKQKDIPFNKLTFGMILENWRDSIYFDTLQKIALYNSVLSQNKIKIEFNETIQKIYLHSIEFIYQTLLNKIKQNNLTLQEKKELQNLIKVLKQHNKSQR